MDSDMPDEQFEAFNTYESTDAEFFLRADALDESSIIKIEASAFFNTGYTPLRTSTSTRSVIKATTTEPEGAGENCTQPASYRFRTVHGALRFAPEDSGYRINK